MTDPIKNNRRHSRRGQASWGVCARCLNDFPAEWLDSHHVFGRATDDQTVLLCKGCHQALTRGQRDLGVSFNAPGDPLRHVANLLLGMAATLEILIRWRDLLVTSAEELRQLAARLDNHHPGWNDNPGSSGKPGDRW